jgi:16S rRNA (uracil1498-N3)-methyltransferase
MIRLLVPHAQTGSVTVEGERLHYLSTVLRLTFGDVVEVFDGNGRVFSGTIQSMGSDAAVLILGEALSQTRSRPITIVQGLPKADRLELVLQKGTELGAASFMPVACTRSVVKLDGKEEAKQARWQRIVEEAARQCGRADVPTVALPDTLSKAAQRLAPGTVVLILDEEERSQRLSRAVSSVAQQPIALVVGPEGGLTREEVGDLVSRGAVPVSLGRLVLRTETAALAALAIVRHLDGELG